jgi:hypothetical protein
MQGSAFGAWANLPRNGIVAFPNSKSRSGFGWRGLYFVLQKTALGLRIEVISGEPSIIAGLRSVAAVAQFCFATPAVRDDVIDGALFEWYGSPAGFILVCKLAFAIGPMKEDELLLIGTEKVVVDSHPLFCLTFDEIYQHLERRINFYLQAAKLET